MKLKLQLLIIMILVLLSSCNSETKNNNQLNDEKINHPILGKWVRFGITGGIGLYFHSNGLVEGDFGNNKTIDLIAQFEIKNDTIHFIDRKGQGCQGVGKYKLYQNEYYIAFDLIDDDCGGRIKTTMGFWTRPNYDNFLNQLDREISESSDQKLQLSRARLYLAIGKPKQAKLDFDSYLSSDSTDARVYINRAGTRFPYDMEGVIFDCNKAIHLNPKNKNAYFLRGLARYELGKKEQACEDFLTAIDLGFSILKIAEQEKCSTFWNKKNN